MKIAILLKSGPSSAEADRALQTAADMLTQGHAVSLYLLQDAIHLCRSNLGLSGSIQLQSLIEKNLQVHVLTQDAALRGVANFLDESVFAGDYDSLVDVLESSDRVVGIL